MEANDVILNLINLYHENKISHAYLIETNNVEKCFQDLKKLIKVISCVDSYSDKCEKCNVCHLIDENIFPNLKVITPEGNSIKKEEIENLKNAFLSRPIYGKNNVYVIKYPEKLNSTAFNKLLKFLEEPEDNIIGFYISLNKDKIAPTIISRCEIIKMIYKENNDIESYEKYDELLTLANEYISTFESKKISIIMYHNQVLFPKLENRTDVVSLFKIIYTIYEKQLISCENKKLIINKLNIISKYLEKLNYNVNTNLLINSFGLEMSDQSGF